VLFVTHSVDEAVFLSDRVVVFGGQPGRIIADIAIDLPRPRWRDEEALKRSPEGGSIGIFYFLPPFARQRLYTYPLPPKPGDPVMDCHWSTMNFFNETPDNRFCDPQYTVACLQTNYYEIAKPTTYGDCVFVLNKEGNAIHSAASRTKNVMGATLVGTTLRPLPAESSSIAGWGESLPQPTAPVRQSWSSTLGS